MRLHLERDGARTGTAWISSVRVALAFLEIVRGQVDARIPDTHLIKKRVFINS